MARPHPCIWSAQSRLVSGMTHSIAQLAVSPTATQAEHCREEAGACHQSSPCDAPPYGRVPDEAPQQISDLIERCMAGEPEVRPDTQEIVDILQSLLDGPAPCPDLLTTPVIVRAGNLMGLPIHVQRCVVRSCYACAGCVRV